MQETVDALRVAIRPFSFGKGIDTLPDEILSIIFESLGPGWFRFATRTLNLVSRRFRHVVLNTPRLWCDVSTRMSSMDGVIRHLERSKSTGLNVDVVPSPLFDWETPCLDQLEVFDAVLPHAGRWERFAVDIGLASKPLNLRERLTHLTHLPRLKELCLECYVGVVEVDDPSFLDSLYAPQLHRLHIINCVPGRSTLFSSLTSLEIGIWDVNGDHQLSQSLCKLLASIPNLTEASLTLTCFQTQVAPGLGGEFPPCFLRKLKILSFTITAVLCDQLLSFRKALITPAIVECTFSVRNSGFACSAEADGVLYAKYLDFMLCHDEYPTLEALSIDFDSLDGCMARFNIPFEKVPNLCELTVDIHGFYPDSLPERVPALRSLTIRNLGTDAWKWVKRLWEKLRQQGDLPNLQKVVIGDRTVSQEWVEECFEDGIFIF